jgi:hypothetical protein
LPQSTAAPIDFAEHRPTYSKPVSPTRAPRIVSTVAALAVALAGLLPFAHVHAGEHHPVVHRHIIGDGAAHHHDVEEHDSNIDQPEHADARIVSSSWLTAITFSLTAPASVTSPPLVQPQQGRVAPMLGTTLLPTHDPPLRYTSSPAPPALV